MAWRLCENNRKRQAEKRKLRNRRRAILQKASRKANRPK